MRQSSIRSLLVVATLMFAMIAPSSAFAQSEPANPPNNTTNTTPTAPSFIELFFGMAVPTSPQSADDLEELYHDVWTMIGNRYYNESKLQDWGRWEHAFDGRLNTLEDLDSALNEMLSSLGDEWTWYGSPTEGARRQARAAEGWLSIGLDVKATSDGGYVVDYLRVGLPAYGSPLRKGDTLKSVNDKPVNGLKLAEVEAMLEGKAGGQVKLTYLRGGQENSVTLTFVPRVESQSEAYLLPGKVLYLKLPGFNEAALKSFEKAIGELSKQPGFEFEYIVLDLRGNSGGSVDVAVHVVEMFLEKGTIMTYDERTGRISQSVTKRVRPFLPHQGNKPGDPVCQTKLLHGKPMAILINNSTASSSEIVSAALADNERAILVGTTSWGKAVAYIGRSLPNGGWLSLTISGVRSPKGVDWMGKGLNPHVTVEQPAGASVDVQLMRAIEALKERNSNQSR